LVGLELTGLVWGWWAVEWGLKVWDGIRGWRCKGVNVFFYSFFFVFGVLECLGLIVGEIFEPVCNGLVGFGWLELGGLWMGWLFGV
jgi:hypothetical protein